MTIDGGRSEGFPPVAVPVPLPIPDSNARRVYTGASTAAAFVMNCKDWTCGFFCFRIINRSLSDDELSPSRSNRDSYGSLSDVDPTALPNPRLSPCEPPRGIFVLLYFVLSCGADIYVVVDTMRIFYGKWCQETVCCEFLTKTRIDADGHIRVPTAFVVYLCLFVLSIAIRSPEYVYRSIDPPSNPAYRDSYILNMIKTVLALMFLSLEVFNEVSFDTGLFCHTKGLTRNSTACNTAVCGFIDYNLFGDVVALLAGIMGASMSFCYIGCNLFNLMRSKCNGKVEDPSDCLCRV